MCTYPRWGVGCQKFEKIQSSFVWKLESGFRDMAQRELEESDRGEVWECMKGLMLYCGLESLQCLSLEIYKAGVGDILPISSV